jgi:hypothetical protein
MLQIASVPAWLDALRATFGASELDRRAGEQGFTSGRLRGNFTYCKAAAAGGQ